MTVIAFSDDEYERELDARLPDLGQPGFDRARYYDDRETTDPAFHRRRRVARCIEGHRVYLKRNPYYSGNDQEARDEHGFHWVHFPGEQDCTGQSPLSPSESQEHKILKARTVVAFRSAGNDPVRTEVSGTGRAYRSDVQFQRPDGSRFALEIQVSGIDTVTARRRTDLTRRDGIEPLWLTNRDAEEWQTTVPCVRLLRPNRGDTRTDQVEQMDLFVTGIAEPFWERCERGSQCWRRRLHGLDHCPTHLRWRTLGADAEQEIDEVTRRYEDSGRMLGIDTFAERITRGELVIVHAARDDRRGTFPIISTPFARLDSFDYVRELEDWRATHRRRPRLSPATAYCTQPDRDPAPEPTSTAPRPAAAVSVRDLSPTASALARAHQKFVRVLAYAPHELPDTLGSLSTYDDLILVPTPTHRAVLLDHGIPADQVRTLDDATPEADRAAGAA